MTLYYINWDRDGWPLCSVQSEHLVEIWPGAWVDCSGRIPGPVLDRLYTTADGALHHDPARRWPAAQEVRT